MVRCDTCGSIMWNIIENSYGKTVYVCPKCEDERVKKSLKCTDCAHFWETEGRFLKKRMKKHCMLLAKKYKPKKDTPQTCGLFDYPVMFGK